MCPNLNSSEDFCGTGGSHSKGLDVPRAPLGCLSRLGGAGALLLQAAPRGTGSLHNIASNLVAQKKKKNQSNQKKRKQTKLQRTPPSFPSSAQAVILKIKQGFKGKYWFWCWVIEGPGQGLGSSPCTSFPFLWDSAWLSAVLLFAHLEPVTAHSWEGLLATSHVLLSSGELSKWPWHGSN